MISTCTIRHGTQDRPIQEEKEWTTQSTDLTMVYSTGSAHENFAKRSAEFARCLICINVPHHLMLLADLVNANSDHLPILIRLQMKTTTTLGLRRTYVNLKKSTCTLFTPDAAEYKSNMDLKINNTTHGNAPNGSGPYLRPKTHIQHTHSQHLSTNRRSHSWLPIRQS